MPRHAVETLLVGLDIAADLSPSSLDLGCYVHLQQRNGTLVHVA